MATSKEPLRLSREDLYSPQVEAYLQDQEALRRDIPEVPPQPLLVRIIYSSYFYLSLAGAVGALGDWCVRGSGSGIRGGVGGRPVDLKSPLAA